MKADQYRAIIAKKTETGIELEFALKKKEALSPGEVFVELKYSSLNYKDALGVSGRGNIFRRFPIVPGIDAAGIVSESRSADFDVGDEVLATGCGLGEQHDGGYAQFLALPSEWLIKLPKGLSLKEGMILGTAGFTAAICVHRLEQNGQTPGKGRILVTGASGGVGSLALSMLSARGYDLTACSGKTNLRPYLMDLGASELILPDELVALKKPLESSRFAGAIDNVGGEVLSGILASTDLWGNIACVGLAGSHRLNATLMPLILRGVSLLGISSTNCPRKLRLELWQRLATTYKPPHMETIYQYTVPLSGLLEASRAMLERSSHGRVLVDCQA